MGSHVLLDRLSPFKDEISLGFRLHKNKDFLPTTNCKSQSVYGEKMSSGLWDDLHTMNASKS